MGDLIYLDNAATTYPKPERVYEKMDEVNRTLAVNAGRGSYTLAKNASNLIEETREELLKLVKGTDVAEVVFSASATVACNQIIGGIEWKKEDVVYVSPYEHNAVMRPLHHFQKEEGFLIEVMPLIEETMEIDLEKLEYLFSKKPPKAVFVTHCSNVTGYILPIADICEKAKVFDAITVVDASQSFGLIDIDIRNLSVDFLVFAGHKNLYGPFGIGGFFMKNSSVLLKPFICGGTGSDSLNLEMPAERPSKYEASSPNIVAIAGLRAALQEIADSGGVAGFYQKEQELTELLVSSLESIPEVKLYLPRQETHVGIVAFNLQGFMAADVGMLLDEDYNIAVRTGYHCAPLIHGCLRDESYAGVVRASVGRYTTEEEIRKLVEAVKEILEG